VEVENKRISVISKVVASKTNGIVKTAVVKILFILQEVYQIPLGYDYRIYTYGPYSDDVVYDIEQLKYKNFISMELETFGTGNVGHKLKLLERANQFIAANNKFPSDYEAAITETISLFGNKNVMELELSTTIIYVYSNSIKNNWQYDKNAIVEDVHDIKPHFSTEQISAEYEQLQEKGLLKKIKLRAKILA